ncbi:UvrD-helicase domain-containing protein [Corallococcus exiguus]|uniref:ATP-dependent helicase n=1 Tax=unclassified Corallococcus TaxID=2685029 RepID=UPI000EEADF34|nr:MULTISPECIES: UvrD-helicase domain-containing protein [unclassified Corallococcus]NNC17772.1 UvrD-helicase domain-containing protein [Corallococcus exiguus]NRD55161.1 UvrD-helicase domain-containing protein [Corallococcus exiguus]RKH96846.1 AAA family ATPase [Corallococcus sp. AB030]RUO90048.1 AAA family ATPase [Corallococcus sp. AB018]
MEPSVNAHETALLEDLNPPQAEAVLHGDGPLLVLSGAGSGKTRVITRRVAHLVKVHRVFPWRILAVTFTNKAAREMRDRLTQLLGAQANDLVVSTFHSSAAMILRREAEAAGLTRSFVIYDDGDQLSLVKRAMRDAGVEPVMQPREILHRIDQEKNAARLPEDMRVEQEDVRGQIVKRVYAGYQKLLRAANAVDFGDLLLLLVKLFRDRPDVLERYRTRFTHVLVDEFQDTNPVQYAFLRQLAPPPSANLVVVGDDDQSIYRWRGADVDNILQFPMQYPGAKVVKLEQNYRSDQNILTAAHEVISKNPRRMQKKLWSERPKGENLELLLHRDERAEAQEVARRILAVQREGFIKFSSMAVFYRTNAQSRVLEEALRLGRVPYQLVSGRSFYDRAEVRDASAYLRLMVNPRSDADLLRVLNVPARGIGDTTEERLTDFANEQGLSLYEALGERHRIPSLNATAQKRLGGFHQLLQSLHAFSLTAKDAAGAVDQMLKESKLVETLVAEGSDEALTRAENLKELLGAAQEFDLKRASDMVASAAALEAREEEAPEGVDSAPLTADIPPLQSFLEQISLVGEADAEVSEGRVALMTLHAAKGLEFDAVFLTGMEEGVFPHSRALKSDDPDGGEEMAEERRLCYVGFTRARKRLFVSLAQCRSLFGELKYNPPSRFLADVPQALFGFKENDLPPPPRAAAMPQRRRNWDDDETGPRVDRSYSQASSDMDGVGGDVRGMRVRHEQFGSGRIVAAEGSGPNAKVTVEFGGTVGLKRVIARFLIPG